MVRFYQDLLGKRPALTGPMAKADALDEAKRWLRNLSPSEAAAEINRLGESTPIQTPISPAPAGARPFDHPLFWAAFILVGILIERAEAGKAGKDRHRIPGSLPFSRAQRLAAPPAPRRSSSQDPRFSPALGRVTTRGNPNYFVANGLRVTAPGLPTAKPLALQCLSFDSSIPAC